MNPGEFNRTVFMWLGSGLLVCALIAGVIIGGQKLGFWLDTQNVKHQGKVGVIVASQNYQITQQSKAYQDAQIAQMNQHLANIEGAGGIASVRATLPADNGEQANLKAQELSELRGFCAEALNVNPSNPALGGANVPGVPALRQLIAANCVAGSPDADPPLARNPIPDGGA